MSNVDTMEVRERVYCEVEPRSKGYYYSEESEGNVAYREYLYGVRQPKQRVFNGKGKQVSVIAFVVSGLLVLVAGMYYNGLI